MTSNWSELCFKQVTSYREKCTATRMPNSDNYEMTSYCHQTKFKIKIKIWYDEMILIKVQNKGYYGYRHLQSITSKRRSQVANKVPHAWPIKRRSNTTYEHGPRAKCLTMTKCKCFTSIDGGVKRKWKIKWRKQKKLTKKKGQKNYNLTETSLNKITEISLTCKDTEKTHNSIKWN
jgi:hypothetical protein